MPAPIVALLGVAGGLVTRKLVFDLVIEAVKGGFQEMVNSEYQLLFDQYGAQAIDLVLDDIYLRTGVSDPSARLAIREAVTVYFNVQALGSEVGSGASQAIDSRSVRQGVRGAARSVAGSRLAADRVGEAIYAGVYVYAEQKYPQALPFLDLAAQGYELYEQYVGDPVGALYQNTIGGTINNLASTAANFISESLGDPTFFDENEQDSPAFRLVRSFGRGAVEALIDELNPASFIAQRVNMIAQQRIRRRLSDLRGEIPTPERIRQVMQEETSELTEIAVREAEENVRRRFEITGELEQEDEEEAVGELGFLARRRHRRIARRLRQLSNDLEADLQARSPITTGRLAASWSTLAVVDRRTRTNGRSTFGFDIRITHQGLFGSATMVRYGLQIITTTDYFQYIRGEPVGMVRSAPSNWFDSLLQQYRPQLEDLRRLA